MNRHVICVLIQVACDNNNLNNYESPDWGSLQPMANEGERLRVLEEQHLFTKEIITDHEVRLRDIEKTVWKALATATAIQTVFFIALHYVLKS